MATANVTAQPSSTAVPQRHFSGIGAYSELAAHSVQVEKELKGTNKFGAASYPSYLPVWDNEKGIKYEPLKSFEHYDHGKDADLSFPNLFKEGSKIEDITSSIGAEVRGVQLTDLSDKGKDELALLVAQKKVVAFRDQNLADLRIEEALEYGKYFGRLHIHPTSGAPAGFPEVHVVHRGAEDTSFQELLASRTNSIAWVCITELCRSRLITDGLQHSDVTYEEQPPGTTFLYALDVPGAGGDTLFLNQAKAYERLSPAFRERLEGLKAVHSGYEQAESAIGKGGVNRRDLVSHIHPLVRKHPVTEEKAIFVNAQFTRYIVGFKKEEIDYLLKFLYDHQAFSQDLQCRVKWAPGTVVVWDNRVTTHSALIDWETGARRHIARITPQAEKPSE